MRRWLLLALVLAVIPSTVWAANSLSLGGINVSINGGANNQEVASAIQILALLTVLSLAPAILVVLTSFTRIIIVLAMLRHAFGMPSTPPNIIIISLALFLTLFTMMPTLHQIKIQAIDPYSAGKVSSVEAAKIALNPIRDFMIRQTREKDMKLLLDLAHKPVPGSVKEIETSTLIPAFLLSELQTAFQIGFVIFLPFLVIDLISASVLMAMGMIMVPPMTISLPLKIMMFVLIEGWALVVQALVGSFH